jgi:hypothetical protein
LALDGRVGSLFTTIVIVDDKGLVRAKGRQPDGSFTGWLDVPAPKDGLSAVKLAVSPAGTATRVVALFSDGHLYETRLRAYGVPLVTKWTTLPFPAPYEHHTTELVMGMSVVPGDPVGSSSLHFACTPAKSAQDAEGGQA